MAYISVYGGLKIFDATGDVIMLNDAGQPVDHSRILVTIVAAYGLTNNEDLSPS